MNINLLDIVKQIIADYGENILENPQRLKAFFSDLAKDEPKPLRIAFERCIEGGAYTALKNAIDVNERTLRKTEIAQRVRDEHGLDITLCGEALDILEAALYGTTQHGTEQTTQKAPGTAPPPSVETPQNSADMPQATTQKKKTKLWVIAALAVAVVAAVGIGLYQAEQAAAAERARVQARARALAIEQEMAEDRARAQAVVAEKAREQATEQAAVAERARAVEQAAAVERASPKVRIVNNTGYPVYVVVLVPSSGDAQEVFYESEENPLLHGGSVTFPLPYSATNRYDVLMEDIDGNEYEKWDIPISAGQTIVFTINDLEPQ
jgi:hypothetical protein